MDCSENINDFWEWKEEDYTLQEDSRNEISRYLWDEVNQDEDNLMYMLNVHTPVKDCTDFGYHLYNTGENTNKSQEEFRESPQLKRRRLLQYDSNDVNTAVSEQQASAIVQTKVMEEAHVDDAVHDQMQWVSGFSGDSCATGHECLGGSSQESQEWNSNFYNEVKLLFNCDEMMSSEGEINISDYCNIPPEIEPSEVPKITPPSSRIKFKGRRSFIETPTKLTTSVAYPFALIKPSRIQGDTTLNDINQRIHLPPPSKAKNKIDEEPLPSHLTSAFSGKPVVSKTKIRTEGGKGSITIMRTKG